jgi:acyl transferase domain-containing protein
MSAGEFTKGADPFPTIFLFGGVGTHGVGTDLAALSASPLWGELAELLLELTGESLEAYLRDHLESTDGEHTATVVTVINMLHASLWRACGQEPVVAVGHSVGEVAAAWCAGMMTTRQAHTPPNPTKRTKPTYPTYRTKRTNPTTLRLPILLTLLTPLILLTFVTLLNLVTLLSLKNNTQALSCALALGRIASTQAGGMLYTVVENQEEITTEDGLFVSGLSYADEHGARLTVSGPVPTLERWLSADPKAVRIPSAHPWHHPLYAATSTDALPATSGPNADRSCVFVSAVGGGRVFSATDCLDERHWRAWLTEPNSLDAAMKAAATLLQGPGTAVLVECGPHPVARGAARVHLQPLVHVASMHRDVPAFALLQVLPLYRQCSNTSLTLY